MNRRDFFRTAAVGGAAVVAGVKSADATDGRIFKTEADLLDAARCVDPPGWTATEVTRGLAGGFIPKPLGD